MNLRIDRRWGLVLTVSVAIAAVLFVALMSKFGGPAVRVSEPYRISAEVDDTRGLVARSEVLARGVHIGEVEAVTETPGGAEVTLAIDEQYAPLDRASTVRVGAKTLFGESYIDVVPGTSGNSFGDGDAVASAQVLPAAVDVDEALEFLDRDGRRHVRSIIGTFGEGSAPAESGERMNAALAQLERLTSGLDGLVSTLDGQEANIAKAVEDTGAVTEVLAQRETTLRSIVTDANATLGALARRDDSLRTGLSELPGLLASGEATLRDARPLLAEAQPLAADLSAAAPELRATLEDLPPVARDANVLLASVPALERAALPFLGQTERVLKLARPVTGPLQAALRNAQPIAAYLSDRKEPFAAWFSNTGDLGSHRDAKGYFARFFVGFEPGTSFGLPTGPNVQNNSYTGPRDAADPQPYSGYERLHPYDPDEESP